VKERLHDVVVGISGGIDSALTAAIAAEALAGAHYVHAVALHLRCDLHGCGLSESLGVDFRDSDRPVAEAPDNALAPSRGAGAIRRRRTSSRGSAARS
jgi:asparagine synthetase B (glutamine-hydrolysing)